MIIAAIALVSTAPDSPFDRALESAVQIQAGDNTGMGVFVLDGRHVLTANHVIEDAPGVWARRPNGTWMHCSVVKSDPVRDLALLRVDGRGRPIRLGTGAGPGDPLFTICGGDPFGYSGGHARRHYDANVLFAGGDLSTRFLEMSCPINMGDSGSMIVDARGELAGICSNYDVSRNGEYLGVDVSAIREFLGEGKWR